MSCVRRAAGMSGQRWLRKNTSTALALKRAHTVWPTSPCGTL